MHADLIPLDRREAVARAFEAVFGRASPDELTPLRGGLSTALVCRAVVGGRPCLLRVEAARDAFRDPARQYACMEIAAAAAVAPPLLFADPAEGVAIMGFIAERPRDTYPGGGAAMAVELGGLLARLQATPVFPPLVDYLDGVDAVIANMLATGVLDPAAARDHFAAYGEIRDAYPRLSSDELVSSHNDPNPSNILYDGDRLWLVDWESAFAGDPHVDSAMVANWFGLAGEGEAALLAKVFGELDDTRRARCWLMRQVCSVFHACMFLGLVAAARGPHARPISDLASPGLDAVRAGLRTGEVQLSTTDGQLLFAKAALSSVLQNARSPTFAAAVRQLR
ncbi:MAG TPA: aminoglycoside phosphotransferase family protein [Caulobacteraceae bacterium]|jgi:hypothetical protein